MHRRLALGLALFAAACSLGDFTGFTGGADAGAPDASTSDATEDGPSDAGSTTDDAAPGSDASFPFCVANADAGFFCEDFEGPSALDHFDSRKAVGGNLVVEGGALVSDVSAADAEAEVYGRVVANVIGTKGRLAFSIEPITLDKTTNVACELVKLYFFTSNKPSYEVGFGVHGAGSSGLYLYEFTSGGTYKELGVMPALAANTLTRFAIEVHIEPSAHVTVDRDGMRVMDVALTPTTTAGSMEAYFGVPYTPANHGAWKFRFDDLLMAIP